MNKILRTLVAGLLFLSTAIAPLPLLAQAYPSNNPTYIPTAILPATTMTAVGSTTFNSNGNGNMLLRVAGTFTSFSATVQMTESRATSPTWTSVSAQTVGGSRVSNITAAGLYRINVAGAAQMRFNMTSFVGTSVIVSAAAAPGPEFVATLPAARATYSLATSGQTLTSSATDFLTIGGSVSNTLRIVRVACDGTATANGIAKIVALKRSTSDTGTVGPIPTVVALDSNNPTSTATVNTYSANPTTGTLVGNLRVGNLTLPAAAPASGTIVGAPLVWEFGNSPGGEQGVVLRGSSEVFALNGAATTFPSGHAINCAVTWTQE